MAEIMPSISSSLMYSRKDLIALFSSEGPLLLLGLLSPRFCEGWLVHPKKARVFNLLSGAESSKSSKAHIETNGLARLWKQFLVLFNREANEPFSIDFVNAASFHFSNEGAVEPHFNLSVRLRDFRKPESAVDDLVACAGITKALVLVLPFSSGKARSVPRFDPAKEGFVSKVHANRNILQHL